VTRRQFLLLLVPLLVVITGFVVLWALERGGVAGAPAWDADFARYVRDRMGQEYVGGTGDERRQQEAYFRGLDAYVKTFDGYAAITPPWDLERARVGSSGRYTGIGVRIELLRDSVLVTGVKPLGPAAGAGIAVGDRMVAVDGRTVTEILPDERTVADLPPDERSAARLSALQVALKGLEGTAMVLRLRAPDGAERDARVVRAQVDQGSVFGARFLDAGRRIGYARVAGFQASTAKDLRTELEKLAKAGLDALVLDLRGDNGGLLDQAVAVANLFLDGGVIVTQRGRLPQFNATYRADPKETWNATLPLAVLVNQSSASASEVLAGALRDHGRCVLVGERTWGKFLVQLVEEVPTDLGTVIFKRTTSIYVTPGGRSYQRTSDHEDDPLAGIPPDLFVPMTLDDRKGLAAVFDDEFYVEWDPSRAPTVEGFRDVQIEAARALLAGEAFYPALP
jgi:carboxyl-terminal processing protease